MVRKTCAKAKVPEFDHDAVAASAARDGWCKLMRQELHAPFMWFRPGEMVLADAAPGEGWTRSEESVKRLGAKAGWLTPDQIVATVVDIARREPWLPVPPPAVKGA